LNPKIGQPETRSAWSEAIGMGVVTTVDGRCYVWDGSNCNTREAIRIYEADGSRVSGKPAIEAIDLITGADEKTSQLTPEEAELVGRIRERSRPKPSEVTPRTGREPIAGISEEYSKRPRQLDAGAAARLRARLTAEEFEQIGHLTFRPGEVPWFLLEWEEATFDRTGTIGGKLDFASRPLTA
jgi:hypothetical protein